MDYNKNALIFGLLVVMLLPSALANNTTTTPGFEPTIEFSDLLAIENGLPIGLNFDSNKFLIYGIDIPEDTVRWISFSGNSPLEIYSVVIQVSSLYSPPGLSTAYVLRDCLSENTTTKINLTTVFMNQDIWTPNAYTFFSIPVYRRGTVNLPAQVPDDVEWLTSCKFTAKGDDLHLSAYILPKLSPNLQVVDPNPSLSNFLGKNSTSGVRGLLNVGFDIVGMMLIILGIVILSLLIVFTWKMFEYFASRLKTQNE
jgi:hypothetical protein